MDTGHEGLKKLLVDEVSRIPSSATCEGFYISGADPGEFCGKLLQSQRQPHVLNLCTPVAVIGAENTDCYASRGYHSRVPKNNYNF